MSGPGKIEPDPTLILPGPLNYRTVSGSDRMLHSTSGDPLNTEPYVLLQQGYYSILIDGKAEASKRVVTSNH
ncbi:MAG TPA: hypothetical protein VIF64_08425 [Pyrinomonadaceae bacterium]